MAIAITQNIIIKSMSSLITFNIMDINNPKKIQNTFKRMYLKVGQEFIYLVLLKILNYSCIYKLK